MRRWKFTPRFWPTLATLAVIPLFVALGHWQLMRAEEKQHGNAEYMHRLAEPAVVLDGRDPKVRDFLHMQHRRIVAIGRFDAGTHILLDNQVHDGEAGYLVYTPFLLEGRQEYVLICRGWVPVGPDRRVPPVIETPSGVMTLSGVAALPPSPGIKLGENLPDNIAPNQIRLQRIEMDQLVKKYAGKLLPYELRLDPGVVGGFTRAWREPGSGRERNLGYAFQWFTMAAVVAFLYLYLNLHRNDGVK